ncbi:MAG: FAD-dependent oxidoreductase [Anaerolineales bacterium]
MKLTNDNPPSHSDVVIIGGGVIGSVTAYNLAKSGIQVVVVDKQDIAAGTSSAAAAAALLQTKTSATKLSIANESLTLLDQLHQELDQGFEYEHSGSLLAATSEAEMSLVSEMSQKLQRLGLEVELLDAKQVKQMMPILGDHVLGGSYSSTDAQINPLEFVVACAKAAKQRGAFFSTYNEVIGIEVKGDKIDAVVTKKGRILTNTIINAAGVWATNVAKMAGLSLSISPLKGQLLVTERMPPLMKGTLIAASYLLSKSAAEGKDAQRPAQMTVGITLVQLKHGNFIVGSTREHSEFERGNSIDGICALSAQLLYLVPSLGNVNLLRAYAGLRPLSKDGFPIIGRDRALPGFIHAVGFGGDGLAMSAIAAKAILGILTDSIEHRYLELFDPNRLCN